MNEPDGGCTSTTSPGRTSRTSQPDTAPPGTSRTPMRSGWPPGRRSSTTGAPPGRRRSGAPSATDRAGTRTRPPARAGTANVTATASSHSRSTRATASSRNWRRELAPARPAASQWARSRSDLLDVLEGLRAGAAPVQVLAGGRAERGGPLGLGRPAGAGTARRCAGAAVSVSGTGPAERAARRPRGGAIPAAASLRRPVGADPVGGPGGLSTVRISTSAKPAAGQPAR